VICEGTHPTIAGFWRQRKVGQQPRQPLVAGKGKEMDSPLAYTERKEPAKLQSHSVKPVLDF
jgi:hypothetical protein